MIEHEPTREIATPEAAAARYRAPNRDAYDLIILGGGSAGLPAARLARTFGASVLLLDRDRLGGECLNTGCVPSKALLHVARAARTIQRAGELGLSASLDSVDLGAVADRVRAAIAEVYRESDAPEHYLARGVEVAFGEVRFTSATTLLVNGRAITGKHFLICTGSHPTLPPTPGLAEVGYLTNESVFDVRTLPASLAIVGGGPIGVELGQAFARLGTRVTILQRPERIIPKDEPEASAALHAALLADRITIHTGTEVQSVAPRDGLKVLTVSGPEGQRELAVTEILVAIGRTPTVADLGLEAAGIAYDERRGIKVDAHLRTTNGRAYAAGDVIGGYLFTHAASREALVAVRNALLPSFTRQALDQRVMPWATFTEPEVAHVGLTEAEARQRYGSSVEVFTQPFKEVDRAVTDLGADGFTKLVAGRDGKLLGATIVGATAGELINELAVALRASVTLSQLAATTHVYPTLALSIQQAAGMRSLARTAKSGTVRLLRRFAR
ncbi:MAG: FAD-dependent oxidoreductase [Ktedonobacterales bacterium]|nr:FAD-dependent oxidoreductase [Ktedonobacterales bacterium]